MTSDQLLGLPRKMKFTDAAIGAALTDAEGKVLEPNMAFVRTLRYAPREIHGSRSSSLIFLPVES